MKTYVYKKLSAQILLNNMCTVILYTIRGYYLRISHNIRVIKAMARASLCLVSWLAHQHAQATSPLESDHFQPPPWVLPSHSDWVLYHEIKGSGLSCCFNLRCPVHLPLHHHLVIAWPFENLHFYMLWQEYAEGSYKF